MAIRRVLIVDDEAEVRSALTDILRAMRYTDTLEIEAVADGQAGLDAVVRRLPDLVLLDLQMPRMSGLTLLKQIHDVESRVPVIVISATDDSKVAAEALRGGAVAYIPKAVRRAPRRDARRHVLRLAPAPRGKAERFVAAEASACARSACAERQIRIDGGSTSVLSGTQRRALAQLANRAQIRPTARRLDLERALLRHSLAGAHVDQASARGG